MIDPANYIDDVKRYDKSPDLDAVTKIVKHLGNTLNSNDAAQVSGSDPKEMARVRDRWGVKKLGLEEAEAESLATKVATEMKADRNKSRVTFYYLMAKHAGKLDIL
jgi:hypothetical protein